MPGEIIPSGEFYDYESKYLDDRSEIVIPARLPAARTEQVRALAIDAYRALDCNGMARVDFLLDEAATACTSTKPTPCRGSPRSVSTPSSGQRRDCPIRHSSTG